MMYSDQITIDGEIYTIPLRYEEGHECDAAEADALNKWHQNGVRNNWTQKIIAAKKNGGFNHDVFQANITEYATRYKPGGRKPAAAKKDPALPEAMNMAKAVIRAELKRKGINLRNVTGASISEFAGKYLAKHPELIQQARARLQGTEDLSALVADMPVKG